MYRALDLLSGETVALKVAREGVEAATRGLRVEVDVLSRLRHPGVVSWLNAGEDEGRAWYAMRLIRGSSLRRLAADYRSDLATVTVPVRLPPRSGSVGRPEAPTRELEWQLPPHALEIMIDLCWALDHVHETGFVHLDLKPDNVMLAGERHPVLIDFGVARSLSAGAAPSHVRGELTGTAAYMAPEMIRGEAIDARADVYALGCMLYELAAGVRPFPRSHPQAVMIAHVHDDPVPLTRRAPGVHPALARLVGSMMAKAPSDRPTRARDVAGALHGILRTDPSFSPWASTPRANDRPATDPRPLAVA